MKTTTNLQLMNGRAILRQSTEIVFSNDERLQHLKNLPDPEQCEFCGKKLFTKGIMINPEKITWLDHVEQCNCAEALKLQAEEVTKKENERLEKERKKLFESLNEKIVKLFGKSGLSPRALICTFDNYIITEQNKHAYNAGQIFIQNFNKSVLSKYGLFITGNIGVGKSFLAFCIANYLIKNGYSVIVTTTEDLLNNIKRAYDSNKKNEHDILKVYKEVDLLIIDDIGKEELSEWGLAKLNNVLYHRHEYFKSVILTTNYNDTLLIQRITPKDGDTTTAKSIIDRLYQTCSAIIITGESWRIKNV